MKKTYFLIVLFLCGLSVGDGFAAAPAAGHLEQKLIEEAGKGDAKEVARLIARGANVNAAGEYGVTALMNAAIFGYPTIVNELVKAGADVNAAAPGSGDTALLTAADDGDMDMVMLLLSNGADKNIQNRRGRTAEELARAAGNEDLANIIRDYRPGGLTKSAFKR